MAVMEARQFSKDVYNTILATCPIDLMNVREPKETLQVEDVYRAFHFHLDDWDRSLGGFLDLGLGRDPHGSRLMLRLEKCEAPRYSKHYTEEEHGPSGVSPVRVYAPHFQVRASVQAGGLSGGTSLVRARAQVSALRELLKVGEAVETFCSSFLVNDAELSAAAALESGLYKRPAAILFEDIPAGTMFISSEGERFYLTEREGSPAISFDKGVLHINNFMSGYPTLLLRPL